MGFLRDNYYAFYRNKIERKEHLYFECSFTKRIWKHIMGLCLVNDVSIIWDEIVQPGVTILKGKVLELSFAN